MQRVEHAAARRFRPPEPFGVGHAPARLEQWPGWNAACDGVVEQSQARLEFRDTHLHPGILIALAADRDSRRQFTVRGIRMIPPEITIDAWRPFDRPSIALIKGELLTERRGGN